MKKLRTLICTLAVLLVGLTIMSCAWVGTYEATYAGNGITLTLNADNTCTFTARVDGVTESKSGTYTVSGNTVTVSADGEVVTFTTSDNFKTLDITTSGVSVKLTKK
ncbi:MAG: hypothetical protein J5930_08515 [Treponema sp.]|nr:hypothetical protein [Treponema sp.]